jgi:branched-chain amino acid transport system ATP-binding protein
MTETLLSIRKLNKRFGAVHATREVSLDIEAGEIHGLIGPNGAGKTTLISQLSGEIMPDSGRILLEGRDITVLPPHKRPHLGLARAFQITRVFERLTVLENLALAVQAHQGHSFRFWGDALSDTRLRQPTEAALERCGLSDRAGEMAGALSHGEKRQLDVGMALAGDPKILLLDEPMAGMGPGGTVKLTELIEGLKGTLTILLVEHDMDVIFTLADRITVLVYGQAIISGDRATVRSDPAVRQAYLGGGED